jgi:hypothetical protein
MKQKLAALPSNCREVNSKPWRVCAISPMSSPPNGSKFAARHRASRRSETSGILVAELTGAWCGGRTARRRRARVRRERQGCCPLSLSVCLCLTVLSRACGFLPPDFPFPVLCPPASSPPPVTAHNVRGHRFPWRI